MVEYQGQRVVTMRQIDELHERSNGTAKRQMADHRNRYEEGRDFFAVSNDVWQYEIRTAKTDSGRGGHRGDIILITERGYGKIVKGWNDDRSWALLDAMQGHGERLENPYSGFAGRRGREGLRGARSRHSTEHRAFTSL